MTTPDIPALREALAAGSGEVPWEAEDYVVFGADGYLLAEFGDDGEPEAALACLAVNALPGLLDLLDAQQKVLDLVRETEAPRDPRRLRSIHEELEDAWTALERLEAPDGR